MYAGGYPDETYVMLLINKKEYTQFGRVFGPKIYLYIGGIFFITAIGFWIQTYMVPEKKETDKPAEKEAAKPEEKSAENTNTVSNQPTSAQTEVKTEAGKPEEKPAENEVKAA